MTMRRIRKALCVLAIAALLVGTLCPVAFAATSTGAKAPYESIVVKAAKGDSLTKIAKRYGTTVASIVSLNRLPNPNALKAGQELIVHAALPFQYTVNKGDTLTSIAKRYNTTVPKLLVLNRLPDANKIKVGQKLLIA